MPANSAARAVPEERLVNLVVALMATERGLTKDTILSSVSGYREQRDRGAGRDALEKMFERDKESLRRLGVPIQTVGDPAQPDDLRDARYRVPLAEYALPDDVVFTPAEAALLTLAGSVWSESSLSAPARSGLRKLAAGGAVVDEPTIGYAPRLSTRDPSFGPLQRALEEARTVSFPYLNPGHRDARTRRVETLALVEYEARWHLFGFDVDLGAERTFLLSRIAGEVVLTRRGFDGARREGAGDRALRGLQELAASRRAVLEVRPGTEAALRLRRRALPAERGVVVPYVDAHVLADELASYGPEVRVVEPDDLRDLVVARLIAVRDAHGGRR